MIQVFTLSRKLTRDIFTHELNNESNESMLLNSLLVPVIDAMGLATQISIGTTAAAIGLTLSVLCLAPRNWTDRTVAVKDMHQTASCKKTDDGCDSRLEVPALARP